MSIQNPKLISPRMFWCISERSICVFANTHIRIATVVPTPIRCLWTRVLLVRSTAKYGIVQKQPPYLPGVEGVVPLRKGSMTFEIQGSHLGLTDGQTRFIGLLNESGLYSETSGRGGGANGIQNDVIRG